MKSIYCRGSHTRTRMRVRTSRDAMFLFGRTVCSRRPGRRCPPSHYGLLNAFLTIGVPVHRSLWTRRAPRYESWDRPAGRCYASEGRARRRGAGRGAERGCSLSSRYPSAPAARRRRRNTEIEKRRKRRRGGDEEKSESGRIKCTAAVT